tara:strand:- start:85 stop:357 length:273 start_codon:yes stop_codon:yes gene_type:complete
MWFVKTFENMIHNLAFIDNEGDIKFVDMAGYFFDELSYESIQKSEEMLVKNGFARIDDHYKKVFGEPGEIKFQSHPSQHRIYSSGEYWAE